MTTETLYLPKSKILVITICVVRIICLCVWIGGMIFATLQIFWAAEDLLEIQRNPKLNPGYFSEFLNRGKDDSDFEWEVSSSLFFNKLIYWFSAYILLSKCVAGLWFVMFVSPLMSFLFLGTHVGWLPTAILILQPVSYWFLMKIRSKIVVWLYTMGTVFFLNTSYPNVIVGEHSGATYHFIVVLAWNCCRCVSFVFEYWNRPRDSIRILWSGISYCFYFPLVVTGPLITFDHYEKHVQKQKPNSSSSMAFKSKLAMVMNLLRVILIGILLELIFYYFYVRPLAFSEQALKKVNLWVVCGSAYWFGQIFTLKYQVLYGLPSFVAEVDGVSMHPLPPCPAYIHRYSVLWKDFDRGLYYFLIKYIYIPTLNLLNSLNSKIEINQELSKFLASILTFAYIYVWHGTAYFIFLWTSFNFLGITIEKIGSCIKGLVDKRWKMSQITWDFLIEPIVTVPLVGMSMLSACIFCGSLQSAKWISMRLWNDMGDCYILIFLYCLTQFAVTKRTWKQFFDGLKNDQKTL